MAVARQHDAARGASGRLTRLATPRPHTSAKAAVTPRSRQCNPHDHRPAATSMTPSCTSKSQRNGPSQAGRTHTVAAPLPVDRRGSTIGAGQPTPAQIRPCVLGQTPAGVCRIAEVRLVQLILVCLLAGARRVWPAMRDAAVPAGRLAIALAVPVAGSLFVFPGPCAAPSLGPGPSRRCPSTSMLGRLRRYLEGRRP